MGCSGSNDNYWKAYKLMKIIDSDSKLSRKDIQFYLISTKFKLIFMKIRVLI